LKNFLDKLGFRLSTIVKESKIRQKAGGRRQKVEGEGRRQKA
jgi:hypothetical protein